MHETESDRGRHWAIMVTNGVEMGVVEKIHTVYMVELKDVGLGVGFIGAQNLSVWSLALIQQVWWLCSLIMEKQALFLHACSVRSIIGKGLQNDSLNQMGLLGAC
jgi:hypothetical protein